MALVRVPSLDPFVADVRTKVAEYYNNYVKYQNNYPNISDWIIAAQFKHSLAHQTNLGGEFKKDSNTLRFYLVNPHVADPFAYTSSPNVYTSPLASVTVDHFTNNCGSKAITLLCLAPMNMQALGKHLLFCIESWLHVYWKVSLLVGSDVVHEEYTSEDIVYPEQVGSCICAIKQYGNGYEFGTRVHNYNYKEMPWHKICVYWKDLTKEADAYAAEYSQWQDISTPTSTPT